MSSLIRKIFSLELFFTVIFLTVAVYTLLYYRSSKRPIKRLEKIIISSFGGTVKIPKSLIKTSRPKLNKSEERCREIFEDIFGVTFKSIRPDWLRNPVTGKNLELDGYNPNINTPIGKGLAFEYDGIQHSKYSKHFHRSGSQEFIYQTKKDTWKDMMCKKMGVKLIRIPYFIVFQDLENYIRSRLSKEGFDI